MMAPSASGLVKTTIGPNKIPIRNLWLLMLYASDLYKYIGTTKVDAEENPEEVADLVAKVLCHQVEERLKRNLSNGYQAKAETVTRLRGRIDVLTTERNHLLERGKVHCKFDELSLNTPRNRYARAALNSLTKLPIENSLSYRCRKLSLRLEGLGVSAIKPASYNGRSERFGRHDSADQKMVAAAELALTLQLPTETAGLLNLVTPNRDESGLRRLFEKAIAGFYAMNLNKTEWNVFSGKRLQWQVSDHSPDLKDILPNMQTDIMIDSRIFNRRLIIDTKFNAITKRAQYKDSALRSGYIYQMYAYIRSQEHEKDPLSLSSSGMLLHPSINSELEEYVTIQGHTIWFCTVDLSLSASSIRRRLLQLIDKSFHRPLFNSQGSEKETVIQ